LTLTEEQLSAFERALREKRALQYDSDYESLHGPWFLEVEFDLLKKLLNPTKGDIILDLGCGTGRLTTRFAALCRRVVAVDRSKGSLEVLRDRASGTGTSNIDIVLADLTQSLPVQLAATKAFSVQLLQHIPSAEGRRDVIRRVYGALAPGGAAVFLDEVHALSRQLRSKPREVARKDSLYFHPFTPQEIRKELRSVGFGSVWTVGCGVLYWTKYRILSRALTRVDVLLSSLPGMPWISKFVATIGIKSPNEDVLPSPQTDAWG